MSRPQIGGPLNGAQEVRAAPPPNTKLEDIIDDSMNIRDRLQSVADRLGTLLDSVRGSIPEEANCENAEDRMGGKLGALQDQHQQIHYRINDIESYLNELSEYV